MLPGRFEFWNMVGQNLTPVTKFILKLAAGISHLGVHPMVCFAGLGDLLDEEIGTRYIVMRRGWGCRLFVKVVF